ncbi:MAG: polyhydroxyalkanoic acid system family protein [Burkholderiales bacterium]|jgi:putative polyhydroxyalkanoate system protein|nr:polyhydroxyalkanoic acid system family protein [Burkholderiales bacterium]MBP7520503.1 polyhydroxyalkanoic acid system family protein [Leptothrix sp. (in: b-proteobacteria)]
MSEICIRRAHGMTLAKARKAAEKIADELAAEFEMRHAWEGDTLNFSRSGVHGHIRVNTKEVEVQAKLGFLLAFLRPKIEQEIHRFCDEKFGSPPAAAHAAPRRGG